MGKKIFFGIIILIILAIGGFFLWEYAKFKKDKDPNKIFLLPRLELADVEITSLTADKADLLVKILVKNQLPIGFRADSIQYKCFIDDKEVLKNRYNKPVILKAHDTSTLTLPIRAFSTQLITVLKNDESKKIDSVDYKVEVSFITKIGIRKKIKFTIKKHLPLFYLPEVLADHIHIRSLNFGRAEIDLSIKVKNKNQFPMKMKNMAYQFSLDNHEWVKGKIPGIMDIKATDTSTLKIPIRISFKEVRKTLFDLLKKGEKVNYKLKMDMNIVSTNKMIKNSLLKVESSGSVKSLLQAAKKAKKEL